MYVQVKKLWIDGYSFSCNNPNVTKNNKAENKFNDNEANNNAKFISLGMTTKIMMGMTTR